MKSKFLKLLSVFLIAIMMVNASGIVSYASEYDEEEDEFFCNPGEAYGDLPSPKIKGFKFIGWYTSKSGGQKVTSNTVCSKNDDHSLYARWTPSGGVYHSTSSCSTLSRSKVINSGSVSQSGKSRACKMCY